MLGLAPGPGSPGVRGGLFELHVRTDGNDSLCNGTKDRPADQAPNCAFRSLSAAVAAALPGVIVTIGPGTFSTGQIVFNQAITVRGQAGPPPTLTAQGGTTWLTCAGGVECTFENLAFDGGDLPAVTSGLRIESTGTLSDVTFSHLAGTALVLEGKTSVTRAKFHDLHKGIYVGSVAGSTITDSDFTAVDVGVSLSGGHATVETSRFRSVATAFDVFEGTLDESSELVITRNDLDDVDVYLLADAPFAAIAGRGNRLDGRLQFGTQETSSIFTGKQLVAVLHRPRLRWRQRLRQAAPGHAPQLVRAITLDHLLHEGARVRPRTRRHHRRPGAPIRRLADAREPPRRHRGDLLRAGVEGHRPGHGRARRRRHTR